jgi:RNA polymerase sigma-70 factor (ECF subfamily)
MSGRGGRGSARSAAAAAADNAFREEWGRIVAALIRRTGDWDLAEECASDAFAQALDSWPRDGTPARPGAWLTTVASHRALDRLRRARRGGELLETIGRDPLGPVHDGEEDSAMRELLEEPDEIGDDRLRLIFTCCHPALALEARVALTLRSLAGLTTAEIAHAFLVSESTMARRLTRTKSKIAQAGIPYRVPPAHLLPERTAGVLAVLWLLFNEGYTASAGQELIRAQLCEEAIRLGRALVTLMPDEPEASGLLALMLLQHSRRLARVDRRGDLVTLEEQDRARWDAEEIAEGLAVLGAALRRRAAGPYQLQAAIAACHAEAPDAEATDWPQIAALYELLGAVMDTPVVHLNRAVAVAMAGDFEAGLEIVARLDHAGELAHYHLLYATRADLLRRRGDREGACEAYRRALELAGTEPEQRFLSRRLAELE